MDNWKLVLWSLFLTLFVPLLLWSALFARFGWPLFVGLFGVFALAFALREKFAGLKWLKAISQMMIPFALTFKFYDALHAGKQKKAQEGNVFQVLLATARGFLHEPKAQKADTADNADKALVERDEELAASKAWLQEEKAHRDALTVKAQQNTTSQSVSGRPSEEELDRMLAELKQKHKEKE